MIEPLETIKTSGERTLKFTVPGPPIGQGRPRFTTIGGHVKAYDPAPSREHKETVRSLVIQAMEKKCFDILPASMPVSVSIKSFRPVPQSKPTWFKRAAALNAVAPLTKPDADNLIKGLLDAMNGIVYADDKQIIDLHYSSAFTDKPRTEVTVTGFYQNMEDIRKIVKKAEPEFRKIAAENNRIKLAEKAERKAKKARKMQNGI